MFDCSEEGGLASSRRPANQDPLLQLVAIERDRSPPPADCADQDRASLIATTPAGVAERPVDQPAGRGDSTDDDGDEADRSREAERARHRALQSSAPPAVTSAAAENSGSHAQG